MANHSVDPHPEIRGLTQLQVLLIAKVFPVNVSLHAQTSLDNPMFLYVVSLVHLIDTVWFSLWYFGVATACHNHKTC